RRCTLPRRAAWSPSDRGWHGLRLWVDAACGAGSGRSGNEPGSIGRRSLPVKPILGLATLVLLAAPAAARAQFPTIGPGQTVEGSLSETDPLPSARGRFKVYQFRASHGDRLTATMRSTEVDAFLRLAREVGGVTDEIASDDDGGGDGDARLR